MQFIKTQPSTPKTEYEEALERYKTKRSKRKWTRAPEQRLSIQAQNKPRDEKGRFINAQAQKEECLKKQLDGKCVRSHHIDYFFVLLIFFSVKSN